ncbi:hypothetical protein D3C87_242020 [compost metagenome]
MKLMLSILFTCAAVLWHSPVFAAGPQCRRVWLGPANINEAVHQKLTDLHSTLANLRKAIKTTEMQSDPLSALQRIDQDPREIAYLLQGAYRLIISHPSAKTLLSEKDYKRVKKGLDELKWLEKTLGKYSVQTELLETAVKNQLPADFIYFLAARRDQVSQESYRELKEADYLNKEISAVMELTDKFSKVEIPREFDQTQWLRISLQNEVVRINGKVSTEMAPLIRKDTYGYRELEEGAHAFRRSLRWIKVYLNAYSDHFSLVRDSNKSPATTELIERYKAKFSLRYDDAGPIKIRDTDYAKIIKYVDSLRKVKKTGEMQELLTHELTTFGRWNEKPITHEEAARIIESILIKEEGKLERKTKEILDDYEATAGFKDMIVEVKP